MATLSDPTDSTGKAAVDDLWANQQAVNTEVGAISAGSGVLVSSNDTTVGYLNGKLTSSGDVTLTEGSDGADETLAVGLDLAASATMKKFNLL
jgi:hypothetical protein